MIRSARKSLSAGLIVGGVAAGVIGVVMVVGAGAGESWADLVGSREPRGPSSCRWPPHMRRRRTRSE